ncbi:MAG: hypothetical protein HGA65_03530 [Oscillochloris sp.]|nr:hypothetical protein [Oscillochloris sp.]
MTYSPLLSFAIRDQFIIRPYTIAVTGHRNLQTIAAQRFVQESFRDLLEQLRQLHPEGLVALSGLAEGTDTLFADEVLRLGLPLEGVIASTDLIEDFAPGPARDHYLYLRDQSQVLHQLPYAERSAQAYTALGYRLVACCDLLIAAWNGLPPVDSGGTGGVVAYALHRGCPVIHIHTLNYTIARLTTP